MIRKKNENPTTKTADKEPYWFQLRRLLVAETDYKYFGFFVSYLYHTRHDFLYNMAKSLQTFLLCCTGLTRQSSTDIIFWQLFIIKNWIKILRFTSQSWIFSHLTFQIFKKNIFDKQIISTNSEGKKKVGTGI